MKRFQNILFSCLMGVAGLGQAHESGAAAQQTILAAQPDKAGQPVISQRPHIVRSDYVVMDGVVFSSVPEPEGWAMYLLGLGCVVYQIKRRRNKSAAWNIRKTNELSE
jgi:hypothetical protein